MIVSSFIIQANVITIVNYDRQTFIVQATDQFQKVLNKKKQFVKNLLPESAIRGGTKTIRITTLSIMTLSIGGLFMTHSIITLSITSLCH